MTYTLYTSLLAGSLFVGMLILLEVGRRIGIEQTARDPDGTLNSVTLASTSIPGDR